MNSSALQQALHSQSPAWQQLVAERCPHLFAQHQVTISPAQLAQMQAVIAAVERVVKLPNWCNSSPPNAALGVFFGYDFHLNEQGAHLIEINTNAGGGFLNALLQDYKRISTIFLDMFRHEWQLCRGDQPLRHIVIVDEQPQQQYLYPEFLLAQQLFQQAGIQCSILDPHDINDLSGIDLIYNRLTDFSLQQYPVLLQAYQQNQLVITPHPQVYQKYADKRNLARLSDASTLAALGATADDIQTLLNGIPATRLIEPLAETSEPAQQLWAERKQWFFKPNSGYASKGAYRGDKLTKRVFGEILQGDYVAQKLAPPGELENFKYDIRCYVYDGKTQLIAARLYQGQTVNFRTEGGGFAVVVS